VQIAIVAATMRTAATLVATDHGRSGLQQFAELDLQVQRQLADRRGTACRPPGEAAGPVGDRAGERPRTWPELALDRFSEWRRS
jgi:hypothetical protein